MSDARRTGRTLLLALGIGDYNATMVLQYLWIAPATTDPKSSPIMIMVEAIQKKLGVADTGMLDQPTATALRKLIGPGWMHLPWATVVEAVIEGGRAPFVKPPKRTGFTDPHLTRSLNGFGDGDGLGGAFDFLPSVPGGALTYGVGAYLLYRHLTKKR